jgi:site-specific DNA-methyltransferase (cytosine-N4-specific)
VGNSWQPGKPVMSTLALESLLAFRRAGKLNLCQQFIWYNPARLPAPAQWVTVERIRLKDAYTHLWWMSPSERPKADNRKVLSPYSDSMKKLLKTKRYNAGPRPSEYDIGETSFLKNNQGAIPPNLLQMPLESDTDAIIPPNVVTMANTHSSGDYLNYCRENDIELHPARMPAGLAEFFISFLTDQGDLVLDPFGGSNTTGAAAEHLGRSWLTIEANPEYIRGSKGRFPSFSKANRSNDHPAGRTVGVLS